LLLVLKRLGLSTIEQELADWAKGRYPWQQYALRRIATGQPFTQAEVVKLVDEIIANKYAETAFPALKATDISGVSDPNATVALKCIRDPTNVNALLEAQELTFAEIGLTVVFGDNASANRATPGSSRMSHRRDTTSRSMSTSSKPTPTLCRRQRSRTCLTERKSRQPGRTLPMI
jgi:hypothetical protein